MMQSLLALAALAVVSAGDDAAPGTGMQTDMLYFQEAPGSLHGDLEGVLTLTLQDPGEGGGSHLVLRAKPSEAAKAVVDCRGAWPQPLGGRKRAAKGRPAKMELCGMRLFGWDPDALGRIRLAATSRREAEGAAWIEVVRDPAEDERGWIRYQEASDATAGIPAMEHEPLERWVRSTGSLRKTPLRTTPAVLLRVGPYDHAALAGGWVPDAPRTRMRYLGIQGSWLRVEIETPGCRSEAEDPEAPRRAGRECTAGWTRWRADSGELLLFPAP